ncbi:MAG: DNA topoisomerase [Ruminococcaceae bacterium]|nr:DNA topoisomerase [Oscillospiraceae bacterium]
MAKKEYGDQSITSLKGADRVRKKPAVIFGSDGLDGCEHAFFEILSNSVDEAREGHGNRIITTVFKDNSIEVEDDGRGVPMDYNEREGKYNWELVFCELYAGGKYENNNKNASYSYSLGTNGLGACATQCASRYMVVKSHNGQNYYEMNFSRGEPEGELIKRELKRGEKKHGTIIRWLPDLDVFRDIAISPAHYADVLERQAIANAGIHFILRVEADKGFEEKDFYYEKGIVERVAGLVGEKSITMPYFITSETSGRDREDLPEYKLKMEAAFCFSNYVQNIEYYHNSSWLEHGGAPDKATRSAFVSAIDKYIKDAGKYKKNESKITFSDVEDSLVLVTNCFSTEASYANQTKKAITNQFIASAMTDFFKKSLEIYFAENPVDAEAISAQVLLNKRARETAETTKLDIKKKLSGNTDVTNRVEKFVSCRSKDPERRELYIVEGDSALSSCKLGRDAEFQAIIPVRGKTLNCLKSTYDKIFKNEIIVDLLKVIGCGAEIKSKSKDVTAFDINALKWSKIIICTDADEDGFQIRALILTLFYRLLPTLLKMGRIYIAESPLFEITAKDDTYFAYDEKEKADIIKKLDDEGKKYTLQRSKGLGENEPEMMWKTTMNPASRRLIRVCEADAQETAELLDILLGDNLAERKRFITENSSKYVKDADIS